MGEHYSTKVEGSVVGAIAIGPGAKATGNVFLAEWAFKLFADRSRMVQKMRSEVNRALGPVLSGATTPLELRLAELPSLVAAAELPMQASTEPIWDRSGAAIADVFEEAGRNLLIVGDAGSGKTTLLLRLAQDLLNRTGGGMEHQIPVPFFLAAWQRGQSLENWLMDQLVELYNVPRRLAKKWMDDDLILPLLDGLDEVGDDVRRSCALQICNYKEKHGLGGLVVACRATEYGALNVRLPLGIAVNVLPLSDVQVEKYVRDAGIGDLRPGVEATDATDYLHEFRELLDNPFWLSLLVASQNRGNVQVEMDSRGQHGEDGGANLLARDEQLKERRRRLMDEHIDRLFHRRRRLSDKQRRQIERTLTWLARQMVARRLGGFLMLMLRSDDPECRRWWLPKKYRSTFDKCVLATLWAATVVHIPLVITCGVWIAHALQLSTVSFALLSVGTLVSAVGVGALVAVAAVAGDVFATAADVDLDSRRIIFKSTASFGAVFLVVVAAIVGCIIVALLVGTWWMGLGLAVGVIAGLFWGLDHWAGFVSWPSAILLGIAGLLPDWMPAWPWTQPLGLGLLLGWTVGVSGAAVATDHVLEWQSNKRTYWAFSSKPRDMWHRLFLARAQCLPLADRHLFDSACGAMLLKRVGGGYVFAHRIILEHFANRTNEPGLD